MRYGLFTCFLIFLSIAGLAQQHPSDSIRTLLEKSPEEKKIEILQSMVIRLWLNQPDSAMQYAREVMAIARETDNIRYEAIANRLMGGVQSYKSNYDSSLRYNKKALELSILARDSFLISSAMNNVGLVYYYMGDYPPALENLLRSLSIKYIIKQDYGLGLNLSNIGLVYTKLKDYPKARDYFNEALKVSERLKDDNIKLYSKNNIGFTYLYENKLEKAENYFKQSLKIAQIVDNTNWHATAYSGLAQVYLSMNRIAEAKRLFKISLELRKKIGEKNGISEIYLFMSRIYARANKLDSAFINARISLQIAEQTGAKERRLENLALFKDLYAQKKQYDSALFFQSRFIALRDSLFNENMARNLVEIQLKVKDEETRQQLEAKDIQLQKRTMLAYFLTAVVVLVLFFSALLYRYYHVQKKLSSDLVKKNTEITSQKEEIQTQKEALLLSNTELEKAREQLAALNQQLQSTVDIRTKELEVANRELRVVNLELDNFIYKSSHDIKGPLVRLLGICHVALLDITDEKARDYLTMLNTTAKHLNEIFDRLKIVSDINGLVVDKVRIDFGQILRNVKTNLRSLDGYDQIRIMLETDGLELYSDPFLIETIFHNMIENAVRFQKESTRENKFIRIKGRKSNGNTVLSFTDNGIGIKQTEIDHIFKMFSQAALEHHTVGLGLYIVKQCAHKLNGGVSLVRSNERYTEFEVMLPN
ncbi:MAG: tetratricopeptide repeat protein [Bacteroidota bacterium]